MIPGRPPDKRRNQVIYYLYKHNRRRSLRGIDQQVAKAEKAVTAQTP